MTGLISGSHQYRIVSIPVKCQLRPVDRHVWTLLIGHILPLKLIQPYGLAVAGDVYKRQLKTSQGILFQVNDALFLHYLQF